MTLSLVVLSLLSAPTDVGSKWSWNVENTFDVKVTPRPPKLMSEETIGKLSVDVKVTEAGAKKLLIKVLQGTRRLQGTSWNVENNYGDAIAKEAKENSNFVHIDDLFVGINAASQALVTPDVLVEASRGDACTDEVRAAMLKATLKTVERVIARSVEFTSKELSCGKSAGRYDVKFTVKTALGNNSIEVPFSGTVDAPRGAMHASYKFTGAFSGDVVLYQKTSAVKVRAVIASSVTPKK